MFDPKSLAITDPLTRRALIQKIGSAALLVGATPFTIAGSELVGPFSPAPPTEPPEVFKLITLWLALTTNKKFKPFDATKLADLTGFKSDLVTALLKDETDNATTYDTIRTRYEVLEGIVNYGPGQCPGHIETLQPISRLRVP